MAFLPTFIGNLPASQQPWRAIALAWGVLLVVSLDGIGVSVRHVKLEVKGACQSNSESVQSSHGETLKRRHAGVESSQPRARNTSKWAGAIKPLVVVDDLSTHAFCRVDSNR